MTLALSSVTLALSSVTLALLCGLPQLETISTTETAFENGKVFGLWYVGNTVYTVRQGVC